MLVECFESASTLALLVTTVGALMMSDQKLRDGCTGAIDGTMGAVGGRRDLRGGEVA